MKFKTQFIEGYAGTKGEVNSLPSKTVPDMNIGIKKLLENHSRGLSLGVHNREGEYFEDEEIPVFDDITDMVEYKESLKARQKEVEKNIKTLKDEQKKRTEAAEKAKKAREDGNPYGDPKKPSQAAPEPDKAK